MIPLLYLKHAIPNHVHHMFYPVQEAGMPPCSSLCAPIHDSPGYVLGMYSTSTTKVCHILCCAPGTRIYIPNSRDWCVSWCTWVLCCWCTEGVYQQHNRLVCHLNSILVYHNTCVITEGVRQQHNRLVCHLLGRSQV